MAQGAITGFKCAVVAFAGKLARFITRGRWPALRRLTIETDPRYADLCGKVSEYAFAISAPAGILPKYGRSIETACNFIEIDAEGYHYVTVDSGREELRRTTGDVDELLFWIFADVTREMAWLFQVKSGQPGQDPRRVVFKRQLELLHLLDEGWKARQEQYQRELLHDRPFDDKIES